MKQAYILPFLAILLLSVSCSKENDKLSGNNNGYEFQGNIAFDWATEGILNLNMETGEYSTIAPSADRSAWDISMDYSLFLDCLGAEVDDAENWYDAYAIEISNLKTGQLESRFIYFPPSGFLGTASLSHDKKLILISPEEEEDGITILDRQGNVLHRFTGYNNEPFDDDTNVAWLPDNSFIFTMGQSIYKVSKDYSTASLIASVNFKNFGWISVSKDGSKIAFNGGKHIWMVNTDGSELVQVTESSSIERASTFSPDGKYLLIGVDWRTPGMFGSMWDLAIIPADGELYNVDQGADDRVIFVQDEDGYSQAGDGNMVWR